MSPKVGPSCVGLTKIIFYLAYISIFLPYAIINIISKIISLVINFVIWSIGLFDGQNFQMMVWKLQRYVYTGKLRIIIILITC
jgi:hypothetical protein